MDMRKRAMGLLAAVLGSAIAGLTLTAVSTVAVKADDCLTAPGGQPASGAHWRFRIDRMTNRQCWYVRSDDQQAAAPAASSVKPLAPSTRVALPRSVANARAEITPGASNIQLNGAGGR